MSCETDDISDKRIDHSYLQSSNCTFRMNITPLTGYWRGTWKNRRESTDAPLKMVQHRPLTANFKDPVMNMTGSQRYSLWILCTFLSRIYGLFRKVFFSLRVCVCAMLGIWFDCTSHHWHGNSRRSLLDADIYGTCIFMSAWCYSAWQPLILAPLIPEEF